MDRMSVGGVLGEKQTSMLEMFLRNERCIDKAKAGDEDAVRNFNIAPHHLVSPQGAKLYFQNFHHAHVPLNANTSKTRGEKTCSIRVNQTRK